MAYIEFNLSFLGVGADTGVFFEICHLTLQKDKKKRKAIVIIYSLKPIQSFLFGLYHHFWWFKRLPFIPVLPIIPSHSSTCRSLFFEVYSVQISVVTSIKPPTIPIFCCTVFFPRVIVVVFRRKHHSVMSGNGILYSEDNINLLQTIMNTWILKKQNHTAWKC